MGFAGSITKCLSGVVLSFLFSEAPACKWEGHRVCKGVFTEIFKTKYLFIQNSTLFKATLMTPTTCFPVL